MITKLNIDILECIFSFLSVKESIQLLLVCKCMYRIYHSYIYYNQEHCLDISNTVIHGIYFLYSDNYNYEINMISNSVVDNSISSRLDRSYRKENHSICIKSSIRFSKHQIFFVLLNKYNGSIVNFRYPILHNSYIYQLLTNSFNYNFEYKIKKMSFRLLPNELKKIITYEKIFDYYVPYTIEILS